MDPNARSDSLTFLEKKRKADLRKVYGSLKCSKFYMGEHAVVVAV